jgi:hypothetical protein
MYICGEVLVVFGMLLASADAGWKYRLGFYLFGWSEYIYLSMGRDFIAFDFGMQVQRSFFDAVRVDVGLDP